MDTKEYIDNHILALLADTSFTQNRRDLLDITIIVAQQKKQSPEKWTKRNNTSMPLLPINTNTIDEKVQASFTETVGSEQLNTITTDTTIDLMKDYEYVKNAGNDFL